MSKVIYTGTKKTEMPERLRIHNPKSNYHKIILIKCLNTRVIFYGKIFLCYLFYSNFNFWLHFQSMLYERGNIYINPHLQHPFIYSAQKFIILLLFLFLSLVFLSLCERIRYFSFSKVTVLCLFKWASVFVAS